MLSVELNRDLEQRLANLALQTHRSENFYIEKAVQDQIDDMEDYYLALEVLERIKNGEEGTRSFDEIRKELKIDE